MLNQIIRGALGERAGARTEVAWPAIDVISLMHSTYTALVFFTSVPRKFLLFLLPFFSEYHRRDILRYVSIYYDKTR